MGVGVCLLADLLYYQLVSQHIWRRQSGNLLAENRGQGVFLLADLWIVRKSAGRNGG